MSKTDYAARIATIESELEELRASLAGGEGDAGDGSSRVERMQQQFTQTANRIKEALGSVRDTSKKAAHTVETKIQDNPWLSVLTAAGIGMLLGSMIFRRRGD